MRPPQIQPAPSFLLPFRTVRSKINSSLAVAKRHRAAAASEHRHQKGWQAPVISNLDCCIRAVAALAGKSQDAPLARRWPGPSALALQPSQLLRVINFSLSSWYHAPLGAKEDMTVRNGSVCCTTCRNWEYLTRHPDGAAERRSDQRT